MKFTKIPNDKLTEKRECESARHEGMRYEIRTERKGVDVRAFTTRKPHAKCKDYRFLVWDLENNCKA